MPMIHTGASNVGINLANLTVTGVPAGPLILAGTESAKVTTTTANTKFVQMYFDSQTVTAGSDTRGIYVRLYHSAATTGGGEALRAYTTINDAVVGTAHGAHLSLDFVSSTANAGRLTGFGAAGRNTLHIPNDAAWTSGTLTAVQAEIFSDGAASVATGVTELSFMRVVNDGNAAGIADVDNEVFFVSFQGFDEASGGMIYDLTDGDTIVTCGSIRIKIGDATRYLMYYDAEAA